MGRSGDARFGDFLSLGDPTPGDGSFNPSATPGSGAEVRTPGAMTDPDVLHPAAQSPFAGLQPPCPASGLAGPSAQSFGGHPGRFTPFPPPPWPHPFVGNSPHPASFPVNHPHMAAYASFYAQPPAFSSNFPPPSPYAGFQGQMPVIPGQDPRAPSFSGAPLLDPRFLPYYMNPAASAVAEDAQGHAGHGRRRRVARVPPSPGAGTSRTRSAARPTINLDDDTNSAQAEVAADDDNTNDDDNDDGSDDSDDDNDDNDSSKFPEQVAKLRRPIPPWKDKLFEMFKECIIDWANMLPTDDSAPSTSDPLSPTNTSGSRKRSSNAATQSTASSPSKKAKAAKATDSTATSPSKKGLWVNPSASRKKQLKVTNLLQKLVVTSESKFDKAQKIVDTAVQIKKEEQDDIMHCLDLAVECGIQSGSHEFFFITNVFQQAKWRVVFKWFKTPEERLAWIHNAYSDSKFLDRWFKTPEERLM